VAKGRRGRVILIDAHSLIYRAFFALPPMSTSDGRVTNAVYGFTSMLAIVLASRPEFAIAAFDLGKPTFRSQEYKEYKAGRRAMPDDLRPQMEMVRQVLESFSIPIYGVEGFEADDVIGTLATASHGVRPVDVVTGDRDLFQLVDDANQVRVIYTSRGGVRNADVVDEAFLRDKYAVSNGDAYADMSILRGDTSDGLPGVAGIGEKTAAQLIHTYGDLAGLRAAIDDGDKGIRGAQRTRLEAASAYLDVAPLVVRVARDAPLPKADLAIPTEVADARLLSKVASEYGVTASFNRVLSALKIN
jgi:5'-3' exonuclease